MRYTLEKLSGCCFFNKGLIRHLITRKTLHFKSLTQIWLSKVKAPALPKERWRKVFFSFLLSKVGAQNRVPSKQLYFSACEGSNPSVRSFLRSLSQLTFAVMVDKTSEEEKLRGLRVGSGAVGLVLSLPIVLDLCSVLFSNACLCDSSAAW